MVDTSAFGVATHTPEAELILRTLRKSAEDDARILQLLETRIDTNQLLRFARFHGVLPLLHQRLSSLGMGLVPSALRDELEVSFHSNIARCMAAAAELIEIIRICRSNSIPAIPMKGLVLAQQLYGNIGLRVSVDIDLLVRPQDTACLRELLARRGYTSSLGLFPHSEQAFLSASHQLPLAHTYRPTSVEIHSAMLSGPDAWATGFDALSSHLQMVEICGDKIESVPLENMLLYLCAHGAKHCWERLSWICDVAQLLRLKPDMDWPTILARARQLRWERALFLGLLLARDLLGAPLPEEVEQRAAVADSLAKDVAANLFVSRRDDARTFWRLWFHLRCCEVWRNRLRVIWEVTARPTAADWQAISLPRSLSFLYFPFRLFRLMGKYKKRLFRSPRRIGCSLGPHVETE